MRSYLIILAALMMMTACRKNQQPHATVPTDGMGGARLWAGNYRQTSTPSWAPGWDTSYQHTDSVFALTVVDANTVSVFGKTYVHDSTDVVKGIRYFGTAYNYYNYYNGNGVAYFYHADSIAFVYIGFLSHNGETVDIWHTK